MSNFALNFQDLFEINVTPESTATWARLAAGIMSADPSNNESVAQDNYLDGEGWGSSEVIGAQKTFAFTGHRVYGDTAQDYIAGIQASLGAGRKTSFRYTDAQGNIVTKDCTIASIDFGGGDAGAKQDISFEIHLNGKPTETPSSAAASLSSVVAAGSATGTTKFTATAGASNTLGYRLRAASAGTIYGSQYIDGYVAYTSGANIKASAGQYLQMFEIDANKRVVKFAEAVLASGDIGA